ncbi:hypothetical protein RJ640_006218 [Escallonia rubra]|uniref:Integrase catalytic domain-containing protein n=1 Tax=Escallonia rubra TaxID=112253 RepID=A0AA88RI73_9ASTE|nr:hypothetical protein RJ640_006218 [Escallonia rubra]
MASIKQRPIKQATWQVAYSFLNLLREFNRLVSQLSSIDVKLEEEAQAILLSSSLPKSYETLKTTLLIAKETLLVDDVMSALMDSSRVNGTSSSSQGEGLVFEIINFTPYYAQENGKAEATNKSIKHIMERAIEDTPNDWYRLLFEVLWAFRTSPKSSTGITPDALTYGHDPMLPMEITVKSFRVAMQNNVLVTEYNEATIIKLEDLDDHQLDALDMMHAMKLKASGTYNRREESPDSLSISFSSEEDSTTANIKIALTISMAYH